MGFMRMDATDYKLLELIQKKGDLPLSDLAKRLKIAKTSCWNRIRKLEEEGVIKGRYTILNRFALGLPVVVFLSITVRRHSAAWVDQFSSIISQYSEITEVYRVTGEGSDYQLKVICASIEDYDRIQQELISKIEFNTMSTRVTLQELKHTHALPVFNIHE